VTESREHRTAQLLWDLCGTTHEAPHRRRLVVERILTWDGDEMFEFFADVLAAFEMLGNERPDVRTAIPRTPAQPGRRGAVMVRPRSGAVSAAQGGS
jgi:hypothetical protein